MATVQQLTLASVTTLPDWHPEHGTAGAFPVHAWVVRHRGGVVLVDTGIGVGHRLIDEWYRPTIVPLPAALATVQLSPADVDLVVLSHLHFDHCGQQRALDAPVAVQAAEHEAAMEPAYTVAEWAAIPTPRLRLLDGDEELTPDIRVVSTPGHTPGHQSVVVDTDDGLVVLAAQCAFSRAELESGEPSPSNLHDPSWLDAARTSLARVRGLGARDIRLSHDA